MPFDYFMATIGAVAIGNFLTLFYMYAIWRGMRAEKQGIPFHYLPIWVLLGGAGGMLLIAACLKFGLEEVSSKSAMEPAAATHRFNTVTGKIEVIDENMPVFNVETGKWE